MRTPDGVPDSVTVRATALVPTICVFDIVPRRSIVRLLFELYSRSVGATLSGMSAAISVVLISTDGAV